MRALILASTMLVPALACAQPISQLPAATAVSPNDSLSIVQNGVTKKVTVTVLNQNPLDIANNALAAAGAAVHPDTDGSISSQEIVASFTSALRSAAVRAGELKSFRDYTLYCDVNRLNGTSGTDDTSRMQAAISLLSLMTMNGNGIPRILLHGYCLTGPLTYTRPMRIKGDGQSSSGEILKAGSTAPLATVMMSYDGSTNYYTAGNGPADFSMADLELTSQGNSDSAGHLIAHGLAMTQDPTKPIYTTVHLDRVKIDNMPGDGINGSGFGALGYLDANEIYLKANAGNNVYCNSNYDWRIGHADLNGAGLDNLLMTGCDGVIVHDSTIYSAGHNNFNYFMSGTAVLHGKNILSRVALDGAQMNGALINHQAGSNLVTLQLDHVSANNNSIAGQGQYADVAISGDASKLTLDEPTFDKTYQMNAMVNGVMETYKSAWNIWFQPGSTGNATVVLPTVLGPDSQAYSDPTRVSKVFLNDGSQALSATTATLSSATQNTGFTFRNGVNNVLTLLGLTPTNDGGQLTLYLAGVPVINLSAAVGYARSWIQGDLTIGNGAASATPTPYTLRATDGLGPDVSAANLVLSGGRPTGAGIGGDIVLQTAPPGVSGTAVGTDLNRVAIRQAGGMQVLAPTAGGMFPRLSDLQAALPCNATNAGTEWAISDASGTPAWNATAVGTGAATSISAGVRCNGSVYVYR